MDLYDFLFDSALARKAPQLSAAAGMTELEFETLFGARSQVTCDGGVSAVVRRAEFARLAAKLGSALRCTVLEKEPAVAWARVHGQASALYSLHALDPERSIRASLGGLVHADVRRLEELATDIDVEGSQIMLLSQCVIALAKSVV